MSDVAQDLAELVADTLAAVESWRATGAFLAPTGALDGLPPAEPWPTAPRPTPSNAAPPGRPLALGAPAAPPPRAAPRPAPTVAAPAPRPAPVAPPRAAAPPPAAPAAAPAPAGGGFAGLFGAKWQVALRDRNAEIAEILGGLGRCADCGTPAESLRGTGNIDASLVVLATGPRGVPLGDEGGAMLDRMLLNVLSVERTDVWLLEANACAARGGPCKSAIRRQVDVVAPRLVLAMGADGGTVLGGIPPIRGEWAAWGSADVMPTFHPVELLQRPGDKRAAMEHLTTLRRRL